MADETPRRDRLGALSGADARPADAESARPTQPDGTLPAGADGSEPSTAVATLVRPLPPSPGAVAAGQRRPFGLAVGVGNPAYAAKVRESALTQATGPVFGAVRDARIARQGETKTATFTIDGREATAPVGMMLADACALNGVEVPVFCYEPRLGDPVGACRMCLVRVEGLPKLQTACSTPVRDEMKVTTASPEVRVAQSQVLEMLLINHPLDCPVCDKGGNCPLQDLAFKYGPGRSQMQVPKQHKPKPLVLSNLILLDRERCIKCFRCTRFSSDVSGDTQLVAINRGVDTEIATFDGEPYVAPFSGNVTELCPVGALTSENYRFTTRPWDAQATPSVCGLCPVGCNVELTTRRDEVERVMSRINTDVDDGWLCDLGRYGFRERTSPDRVTAPLVRRGGRLVAATWAEAEREVVTHLRQAGPRVGITAGGFATNEDAAALRRLAGVLGTPHVDSAFVARRLVATKGRITDLDTAEVIAVVGVDLKQSAPVLDLRLRKARRGGARVAVVAPVPTGSDDVDATARYRPGEAAAALADLEASLVIFGEHLLTGAEPGASDALEALAARGAVLLGVPASPNGRGLLDAGLFPSGDGALDGGAQLDAFAAGHLDALVWWGADPGTEARQAAALPNRSFVVQATRFLSSYAAEYADVVLPLASYQEVEGTVTNLEGRVQRLRASVSAPGDVRPGVEVLGGWLAGLGAPTGWTSALAATAEVYPSLAAAPLDQARGTVADPGRPAIARPASRDTGSDPSAADEYVTPSREAGAESGHDEAASRVAPAMDYQHSGAEAQTGAAAGRDADAAAEGAQRHADAVAADGPEADVEGALPDASADDPERPRDRLLLAPVPALYAAPESARAEGPLAVLAPIASTLDVGPADAKALGLADGGEATVTTEAGTARLLVRVRRGVPAGVAGLPLVDASSAALLVRDGATTATVEAA